LDFLIGQQKMSNRLVTKSRGFFPDNPNSKIENSKSLVLCTLFFLLAAAVAPSLAQQPVKIHRLGYLAANFIERSRDLEAFRQGLAALGYIEGRNISIEYRYAGGKLERLPALAAELVALKVDIIVAINPPSAYAAKNATKTIPIVMRSTDDPVESGLVDSLARPGGNVTGLTSMSMELNGKRLEILKEAVPHLSRVAILRGGTGGDAKGDELEAAARALKLKLFTVTVKGPNDFENGFQGAIKSGAQGVEVIRSPLFLSSRKKIAELAAKNRLPAIYDEAAFIDAGGLMSYGTDLADLHRRAAVFVDKILKGAKPADLPVERPIKFEFIVNLKAAKQIGVTISPNVLVRADRVIR